MPPVRYISDDEDSAREPNVVLMHYHDLSTDLEGAMRRLAALLGIDIAEGAWSDLVDAAGFAHGSSGAGPELLSEDELARYEAANSSASRVPIVSIGAASFAARLPAPTWLTSTPDAAVILLISATQY